MQYRSHVHQQAWPAALPVYFSVSSESTRCNQFYGAAIIGQKADRLEAHGIC